MSDRTKIKTRIKQSRGLEITTPGPKTNRPRKTAFPDRGSAAYVFILALFLAAVTAFAAGCGSGLSRSLGNIESVDSEESSPGGQTRSESSHSKEIANSVESPASEWTQIRRASNPDWAEENTLESAGAGETAVTSESAADTAGTAGTEVDRTNGQNSLVAVDRRHSLAADYEPDDLVFVQPLGITTLGGGSMKLGEEAAEAASKMLEDARKENLDLVVCSAYRSYEAQVVSYGRLTGIYGEEAEDLVAEPGHSEHQLGTAIDVSNANVDYRLVQDFASTQSAAWLRDNAVDYGFVLSYPRHAEEHTGYRWEPWHYRYIGKENAREYEEGDYNSPQQFFLERGEVPKS